MLVLIFGDRDGTHQ